MNQYVFDYPHKVYHALSLAIFILNFVPELEPTTNLLFHYSTLDLSVKKRKHAEILNDTMLANPAAIDELMNLFQERTIDANTTADDV